MSSRARKRFTLVLMWIPTLVVSGLLVMIARHEHVAAAADLAIHEQLEAVLKRNVAYAAADVEREQAALDVALNDNTPGHPHSADSHFDAVFGTMDALDAAWALYIASGVPLADAQRAVAYPVRTVLGGAAMMLMALCVGVSVLEGRGKREEDSPMQIAG